MSDMLLKSVDYGNRQRIENRFIVVIRDSLLVIGWPLFLEAEDNIKNSKFKDSLY